MLLLPSILRLLRWLWQLWLWLWLVICVMILLLALLFPKLPEYRSQIEQLISTVWEQPITIGQLSTYWVDGMPTIALQHVHLVNASVEIAYAEVVIDVVASLKHAQLMTKQIAVIVSELALTRTATGRITLVGLPEGKSPSQLEWLVWLWQQPAVSVQASTLTWLEPSQTPLTFSQVELSLIWQSTVPWLSGQVTLPQHRFTLSQPTELVMQAQRITFKMGLLSQLATTIEGQFTVEQLQLLAPLTLPPQLLQGTFQVNRENGVWQIATQPCLLSAEQKIDLPNLQVRIASPETDLILQQLESLLSSDSLSQPANNQKSPAIETTPADLFLASLPVILRPSLANDTDQAKILTTKQPQWYQFIEMSAQLPTLSLSEWLPQVVVYAPPAWEKTLNSLQIKGQLHDIRWQYTPEQTWQMRTRVVDISSQPYEQWPGINGLSGNLEVTPTQVAVTIDPATPVTLHWHNNYNQPVSLVTTSGQVHWQRTPQGGQKIIPHLQAQLEHNSLKVQLTGQIEIPAHTKEPHIHLNMTLRDGNLAQLSRYIPPPFRPDFWSTTQIDGELTTAQLIVKNHKGKYDVELEGKVKQVAFDWTSPQGTQLTIKNLAAQFNITSYQGLLHINQATTLLNLPSLYSHPLSLTQVQGDLNWQRTHNQWQLITKKIQAVDKKAKIQVSGHIKIPQSSGVPQSDLTIDFYNGQLAQIHTYLPDKKLIKTVNWLRQGLIAGKLSQAQVRIQGPFNKKVFDSPTGFKLQAQLNQAHIRYAPNWPTLKQVKAQVVIRGRSLTMLVQRGKLFNGNINQATVTIANLSAPVVKVTGLLHGPAADGLKFVKQSPLRKKLDLARLELDGLMNLHIELALFLAKKQSTVTGQIRFTNTTLHDKSLKVTLTDVAGTLNFSDDKVSAPQMQGKLSGNPITFSLLTLRNQRPKRTTVQLSGLADPVLLSQQLSHFVPSLARLPLTTYLAGTSDWLITLHFPNDNSPNNNYIDILIETDLAGMAVNLPVPFHKLEQEPRLFSIKVRLFKAKSHDHNRIQIQGHYGTILNTVLQITNQRLERGSIVFGSTPAQLPQTTGLTVTGKLDSLSITAWRNDLLTQSNDISPFLLTSDSETVSRNRLTKPLFSLPILVDISVEQLEWFGQIFNQVALQAKYANLLGQLAITSNEVEGQITFNQFGSPSLDLTFKKLILSHSPMAKQTTTATTNTTKPDNKLPNPRDVPIISFHCDELQMGKINLGTVKFHTQTHPEGLKMVLSAQSTGLNLTVQGLWRYVVQQHQTLLQAHLDSDSIELMLQQLGYHQPPLIGGRSQITLNAYWQGAPYPFQLAKIVGNLSLVILEGRIVEVEPGPIGRLFGLFDVYTLPRRLALDFSDIFKKGFSFNTISGVFSLQAGTARTDHLLLQSPSAHIEINGETNLVEQVYQQVVTVFPHLSNPLPVAGALAGGVGVGAVALVVQQLLQNELKKVIYYQYNITGPWHQPKIVSLPPQQLTTEKTNN